MNNNRGYTLIELLVVMAIVALLSGISIFALQGSRESARDAQRKGDLESIRSALELYKADCGNYPVGSGDFHGVFGNDFTSGEGVCLQPPSSTRTYISNVPEDPLGTEAYQYNRLTPFTYELCATLEQPPATSSDCSGVGNYRVVNP